MYSQIFILPEKQVAAHQEGVRRTAANVQWGRIQPGGWPVRDHLLNLTGEVLIRLGTYLKTENPSPQELGRPFDPCEGNA